MKNVPFDPVESLLRTVETCKVTKESTMDFCFLCGSPRTPTIKFKKVKMVCKSADWEREEPLCDSCVSKLVERKKIVLPEAPKEVV